MRLSTLLLAAVVQQSVLAARPAKRHYNTHDYYVLEHDPSGHASLDECAGALGVELVERAGELDNPRSTLASTRWTRHLYILSYVRLKTVKPGGEGTKIKSGKQVCAVQMIHSADERIWFRVPFFPLPSQSNPIDGSSNLITRVDPVSISVSLAHSPFI